MMKAAKNECSIIRCIIVIREQFMFGLHSLSILLFHFTRQIIIIYFYTISFSLSIDENRCKFLVNVIIKSALPSNFPLLTSSELFDFFDEFLDIWLWDGEDSVLFFPKTSWQEYDVCVTVSIGWTVPVNWWKLWVSKIPKKD